MDDPRLVGHDDVEAMEPLAFFGQWRTSIGTGVCLLASDSCGTGKA